LALKPADNETFYREVDDELRRDQMMTLWQRYGKLAIAAVVLLIAAIGGAIWWENQRTLQAGARGEKLVSAFDDIAAGKKSAGLAKLDELSKEKAAGYRAAALLTKADLASEASDMSGALGYFGQVAADEDLPQPYRDLATIRMTTLQFDALKPQAVIDRLRPLAVPGNPWFGSAGEMVALSYLKLNKPQEAARLYAGMARDKKVPDSIRSRAVQMAGSLGIDAVQDDAGAAQEGNR
jgi:hypothetical protein